MNRLCAFAVLLITATACAWLTGAELFVDGATKAGLFVGFVVGYTTAIATDLVIRKNSEKTSDGQHIKQSRTF